MAQTGTVASGRSGFLACKEDRQSRSSLHEGPRSVSFRGRGARPAPLRGARLRATHCGRNGVPVSFAPAFRPFFVNQPLFISST